MYLKTKILVLYFCILNVLSVCRKCRTPNNEKGECVPIGSCPALRDALMSLRLEGFELVKSSQCRHETNLTVCCATSPPTTPSSTENKMALLPTRRFCGYQRFDDYYHTENVRTSSSIDEFPWLASLSYEDELGISPVKCTGSLISARYVLTSAICINPRKFKLVGVRLGEHNFEQNEDCIKDGRFDVECTDPVRDFGIEETIVHPGFTGSKCRDHNLGLIRLNATVTYSDFVRPICLPFPGTKFAKVGDSLYKSGWGILPSNMIVADAKKKISVRLFPNERCMNEPELRICNITDYQSCTLEGRFGDHSQTGDSGGPIMFVHRNQWHQEGVMSIALNFKEEPVDINVKVEKYLDWILESIRP